MLKNPYLNALLATLYIMLVVFIMGNVLDGEKEETLLVPVTVLSLLVLSVSVMAGLFFFIPVKMLMGNEKDEALWFFLKTIGTFAVFVALFMIVLIIYN